MKTNFKRVAAIAVGSGIITALTSVLAFAVNGVR